VFYGIDKFVKRRQNFGVKPGKIYRQMFLYNTVVCPLPIETGFIYTTINKNPL